MGLRHLEVLILSLWLQNSRIYGATTISSLSTSSAVETSSTFSTTAEPTSTAFPSSTLPHETAATTGSLTTSPPGEMAARTSEEATLVTSSFSSSSALETSSTFHTTAEPTSPAFPSSTSPRETAATTGSLTTSPPGEMAARTSEGTIATSSFSTSSALETSSTFHTTAEPTSPAFPSRTSPFQTAATTGILTEKDTTGPPRAMTATVSFLFPSSTVETSSTFSATTDGTTGLSLAVLPPETTVATGLVTDTNASNTWGEGTASTAGDMRSRISSIPEKRSPSASRSPVQMTGKVSPATGTPASKTIPVTHPSTSVSDASPVFSTVATVTSTAFPPTIAATTGRGTTARSGIGHLEEVASTPVEVRSTISTAGDEISPALLFSRAPDKAAAEDGTTATEEPMTFSQTAAPTSATLSSFPQAESTGRIATATGISTAEITPPALLPTIPGERTNPFSTPAEEALRTSVPSAPLLETTAAAGMFAAGPTTGTLEDEASSPPAEIATTTTSTVAEETFPATWSSPAQTERISAQAFLPHASPDETSPTLGALSEATSTVFAPRMPPVEATSKASRATDTGVDHIITAEAKTSPALPPANPSLGGTTLMTKVPTVSDTITSLTKSKQPAAHDQGRIRFILSVNLTTSLNITDPAVRDAIVKKFHQDLHATFPHAGFNVTWLRPQES